MNYAEFADEVNEAIEILETLIWLKSVGWNFEKMRPSKPTDWVLVDYLEDSDLLGSSDTLILMT